jgi:hypothetical protein
LGPKIKKYIALSVPVEDLLFGRDLKAQRDGNVSSLGQSLYVLGEEVCDLLKDIPEPFILDHVFYTFEVLVGPESVDFANYILKQLLVFVVF